MADSHKTLKEAIQDLINAIKEFFEHFGQHKSMALMCHELLDTANNLVFASEEQRQEIEELTDIIKRMTDNVKEAKANGIEIDEEFAQQLLDSIEGNNCLEFVKTLGNRLGIQREEIMKEALANFCENNSPDVETELFIAKDESSQLQGVILHDTGSNDATFMNFGLHGASVTKIPISMLKTGEMDVSYLSPTAEIDIDGRLESDMSYLENLSLEMAEDIVKKEFCKSVGINTDELEKLLSASKEDLKLARKYMNEMEKD